MTDFIAGIRNATHSTQPIIVELSGVHPAGSNVIFYDWFTFTKLANLDHSTAIIKRRPSFVRRPEALKLDPALRSRA